MAMDTSTPLGAFVEGIRGGSMRRLLTSDPAAFNAAAIRAADDMDVKNHFIEQCIPFIRKTIHKILHRHIHTSDDEWSIGLLAFAEAIDGYCATKGDFAAYAYRVMANRLTDHHRRTIRAAREIDVAPHVFTGDMQEEESGVAYAIQAAIQPAQEREGLQGELLAVGDMLKAFGFTFMELTTCSPQTGKTRKACAAAAACMLRQPTLLDAMIRKHALPARRIHEMTGISLKLLDRHRKYIIAVTLLMQGDYPYLQEYLHIIREEMLT